MFTFGETPELADDVNPGDADSVVEDKEEEAAETLTSSDAEAVFPPLVQPKRVALIVYVPGAR